MEPADDRPPLYLALPDWDQGPVSGGHIYNRHFAEALSSGQPWQRLDLADDPSTLHRDFLSLNSTSSKDSWLIVDTLWHDRYLALGKPRPRTALLVHLLAEMTGDLSFRDAKPWPWLGFYQHYLVTGTYAERYLMACGVEPSRITLIEPRIWPRDLSSDALLSKAPASEPVRCSQVGRHNWLTIANLIPGKGILAALESLQRQLADRDAELVKGQKDKEFCWTIYGSHDPDPDYAESCLAFVAADPNLSSRIEFVSQQIGSEPARLLQRCDLYISASVMETYGMAVAEALALGKPVAAISTGNIPYLVGSENAKHHLVHDTCQLMQAALAFPRVAQSLGQPPRAIGHSKASFAEAVAAFTKKVLI